MPDIPFSLLWGSWNSGKDLFLQCLYLRCLWPGAHAAWAAGPNLETYKVEVRERHLWPKWYPECLCQAGWQGERLWNLWILSDHSYPNTQQVSVLAVDLVHFPEYAKWTSLSWWGFPIVLLCVGTHLFCATLEIILKASFFLSNLLAIFPLQFLSQICLKFSLFDSFPFDLEFHQHEERGIELHLRLQDFPPLPEWRGLRLMRAHGICLSQMCHLLQWWDW